MPGFDLDSFVLELRAAARADEPVNEDTRADDAGFSGPGSSQGGNAGL